MIGSGMSELPLPPAEASAQPARRKAPSARRIIAFAVVVGILGLLIVPACYWGERWRGRRAWKKYETEAKARGVKLDSAEFFRYKIPDANNFASIPIFEAAFRADDRGEPVPDPFELPNSKDNPRPRFGDHIKQQPIDLVAWQKYLVKARLLPAAGASAADDVLKALESRAASLAQLQEAARRPHGRFPVHWERHWEAGVPHLELVCNAAKLHLLRMAAHLAQDRSSDAYEDFCDSMRLARALREEPEIISELARSTIVESTVETFWSGLAAHQWAEPELEKIGADLAALDWVGEYHFAMVSERASLNELFDLMAKNPSMFRKLIRLESPEPKKNERWLIFYPSGWHYWSRVRFIQYYDELLARADAGTHRWSLALPAPSSPDAVTASPENLPLMFFKVAAAELKMVEARCVWFATTADQARVASALERFRLVHGSYPAELAELVPAFLSAAPADVVNGEPYHYRRTDDGSFVLYSVGLNLHDDGGVDDPTKNSHKQLDWVWRYPAK